MKKTMFTTAILVAFLFIGNSAANMVGNVTEEINNNEEMSYLMAPDTHGQFQSVPSGSSGRGETIYAQDCTADNYVWFDTDTPSSYNVIAATGFTAFPQGACYVEDVQWTTDTDGNIFTIDPTTGVMTSVGNAGVYDGLVALFYNPSDGTLYGGSITDLYTINQVTGAATLVGPYGTVGGSGWLISLDCDNAGNTYGYNIDNAANAILYSVNLATGAATAIGARAQRRAAARRLDGGRAGRTRRARLRRARRRREPDRVLRIPAPARAPPAVAADGAHPPAARRGRRRVAALVGQGRARAARRHPRRARRVA